jgi:hypothetical protein
MWFVGGGYAGLGTVALDRGNWEGLFCEHPFRPVALKLRSQNTGIAADAYPTPSSDRLANDSGRSILTELAELNAVDLRGCAVGAELGGGGARAFKDSILDDLERGELADRGQLGERSSRTLVALFTGDALVALRVRPGRALRRRGRSNPQRRSTLRPRCRSRKC